MFRLRELVSWACPLLLGLLPQIASAQTTVIDLADVTTDDGSLLRVHGSAGNGSSGVPIASGFDCDGDKQIDYAMAAMRAAPLGRPTAGEIYLVFGDSTTQGVLDTAGFDAEILKIAGDGTSETAGSEIWIDDVTGDGIGDLLICRQNFSPTVARRGAGALSIIVGGSALRTHAQSLQYLDLRNPPAGIAITTIIGNGETDRLCIWARTGDVTGDDIADIVIGSDQEDLPGSDHGGAAYLVRGGAHLASGMTVDLMSFGSTALAGDVARITPPASADEFHFGGTVQIADLDGNGRGEVLIAATLNRAGAALAPSGTGGPSHASGGTTDGTLYIAWDDNFTGDPWVPGFSFAIDASPGSRTILDGGASNVSFGEEILGGLDYDDDGDADLFVGDLVASPAGRTRAGIGHVFYRARDLKGLVVDRDALPGTIRRTNLIGAAAGDISSDTAMHGDFDGDGIDDLATGSPHAEPQGRVSAGVIDILHGQSGGWPNSIDLAAPMSTVRVTQFQGANGRSGSDGGDTLAYSGAAADVDADGRTDLVTNEMIGNGIAPGTIDVGNLIILSGTMSGLFADGFESGDTSAWSATSLQAPLAPPTKRSRRSP